MVTPLPCDNKAGATIYRYIEKGRKEKGAYMCVCVCVCSPISVCLCGADSRAGRSHGCVCADTHIHTYTHKETNLAYTYHPFSTLLAFSLLPLSLLHVLCSITTILQKEGAFLTFSFIENHMRCLSVEDPSPFFFPLLSALLPVAPPKGPRYCGTCVCVCVEQ